MHAKSHLYDVAKVVFGETETEAIQDWVKTTEPLLYDGNITEVAASISTCCRTKMQTSFNEMGKTGYQCYTWLAMLI